MSVKFTCPCGKHLTAPDGMAGRNATCPRCGKRVVIPPRSQPPESLRPVTDAQNRSAPSSNHDGQRGPVRGRIQPAVRSGSRGARPVRTARGRIQIDLSAGRLVDLQKGEKLYPWSRYGMAHQVDALAIEHDCLVLTRQYSSTLAQAVVGIPAAAVGLAVIDMGDGSGVSMAFGTLAFGAVFALLHRIFASWIIRRQHVQRVRPTEIVRVARGLDPHPSWPNDAALRAFPKSPPERVVYHVFVRSHRKAGTIDVHVFCLGFTKKLCSQGAWRTAQEELDDAISQHYAVETLT